MDTITKKLADALRECEARLVLLIEQDRHKLLDAVASKRATEAIAEYDANDGWLPIDENTPRDRMIIFGYLDGEHLRSPGVGKYDPCQYEDPPRPFWRRVDGPNSASFNRANLPTHWQPLPANPRSKS
jgi:hypothetical protein